MFNLSILRLTSNSIRNIEIGVFDNMPNLRKLDLSKNNFKRLPNMMTLEHLQVLSATSMKISYLYPCNFEKLQSLRRMYLANNPLICAKWSGWENCMKWLRELYDEEMDSALRKHMEQAAAIDGWICKVKSKRGKQIKYILPWDFFKGLWLSFHRKLYKLLQQWIGWDCVAKASHWQ